MDGNEIELSHLARAVASRTDGLLVGLNWSGERATGYDVDPADVVRALAAPIAT